MTYIGKQDDPGRTLHINQPNGCKCRVAQTIKPNEAIYWESLWAARASGYTNYCLECRRGKYNGGQSCEIFLP